VEVRSDGRVLASQRHQGQSPIGQVPLFQGIDAELIRLFERWLTRRDQIWQEREIRAFGSLLHRYLFPDAVSAWVEQRLSRLAPEGPVRLTLSFPANPPYSRLAAIPWEYMYRPDRPDRDGYYLATDSRCLLSRYIPLRAGRPALRPLDTVRVLVMVSRPQDPRLGEVVSKPIEEELHEIADGLRFAIDVVHDPSADDFAAALMKYRPHLLHFMGHGEYSDRRGAGSLALISPDGGTDWVDDRRLAEIVRRVPEKPRVIVLHSCEGARADYAESFAGLAPQLVRNGVQCVVAMQYAVTNDTATDFSREFYTQLAARSTVDEAVQGSRLHIGARSGQDPRLLGIPVIYLHSRAPLLATSTSGP
jgi:hypothetical protein